LTSFAEKVKLKTNTPNMKVGSMVKRVLVPFLILVPFLLGFIPYSQVDGSTQLSGGVSLFDETPEPFTLPTAISTELPCSAEAVHGLFFYRTDCPHCAEILDEVINPLEEELGADLDIRLVNIDYADNYELFLEIQESFAVSNENRVIPTLVLGDTILIGEDSIREELRGRALAGIQAGGIEWPTLEGFDPALIVIEGNAAADDQVCSLDSENCDVENPIYAAYFYQTGCQECSMVEADLAYLRSRYPQLVVESFNIYDNAGLAEWMAARIGRDDMHTPAVFIGNQAWIGEDEISPEALTTALDCFTAEGSPRFWDAYDESQGNQNIIERFRSMSWITVVLAGLVDGLNPCAFATLIFFVSYLSLSGRKGKEILLVGLAFTVGVFLAYLLIGLGFYRILDLLGSWLNILGKIVYGITAVICLVFGVLSFSDYLKTRKGDLGDMALKLPDTLRKRINETIRKGRNIKSYALGAFGTGLVVSLLELACTGQVYLPTIIYVSSVPELRLQSVAYLILYNIMFIIPLIVIFVLVFFGTSSKQLTGFIQKQGSGIKLAMSIIFLILGIWLGWSVFG
jgi:cytochrome c biogenesis protein CcdA/thiol-disulfide isomerase/thioredoxin